MDQDKVYRELITQLFLVSILIILAAFSAMIPLFQKHNRFLRHLAMATLAVTLCVSLAFTRLPFWGISRIGWSYSDLDFEVTIDIAQLFYIPFLESIASLIWLFIQHRRQRSLE